MNCSERHYFRIGRWIRPIRKLEKGGWVFCSISYCGRDFALQMASQNRLTTSEDIHGEKWDRCITDTIVKTASGLALGIVFSAILFKRRPWPVFLGTGIGIGMGYSNCQNDLRTPYVPSSSSIPIIRPDRHVPTKPSDS